MNLFDKLIREMPWIDVDGATVDFKLEHADSKEEALDMIRAAVHGVKSEQIKYDIVDTLFDTFPTWMKRFGITKKDILGIKENLCQHAECELRKAGLFDKDSDYAGMIGNAVMDMMKVFAGQGHSGCSAGLTKEIFTKLANYEPLTPIDDNPEDWMNVTDKCADGNGMWQCRRNPALFSKDGGKNYYHVDDPKKIIKAEPHKKDKQEEVK